MSKAPVSTQSGRRKRSSTVYAELRRALMLGEYPLIERLGEVKLAEQFGASRTPVREALMRLESEGLVHRRAEGGFYPSSPNLPDIRELYELRRIIELGTLQRMIETGAGHDRQALEELRIEWERLVIASPAPEPDFVLRDEGFHVGVAAACGNAAIARQLGAVNERIRVVRMQEFLDEDRIAKTVRQHLEIVTALCAGSASDAVPLLAAHLDEAHQQATLRATAAVERMMTAGAVFAGDRST